MGRNDGKVFILWVASTLCLGFGGGTGQTLIDKGLLGKELLAVEEAGCCRHEGECFLTYLEI